MNKPPKSGQPRSAGILLLLGPLAGIALGIAIKNITLGILIGLSAGLLAVLAFWLFDR